MARGQACGRQHYFDALALAMKCEGSRSAIGLYYREIDLGRFMCRSGRGLSRIIKHW